MEGKTREIKQPKVNSSRLIALGKMPLRDLNALKQDINGVYGKYETLGGSVYPHNWIAFINKRLNECLKRLGITGNYKSHSFRINYVTKLLESYPLHKVQRLVSHKNVSTTILYSRWNPNSADVAEASEFLVTRCQKK